jgi:ATP-dependent DNA helicase RecG
VGSGKTIVALCACYFAVLSKKQVAVIAPTSILALQHYKNFKKLLDGLGIRVALLLGSTSPLDKREIRAAMLQGEVDIVIGTHALLTDGNDFKNLALVVIDEQHRFGVAQRTTLLSKGKDIDLLTLSATPIPRSLRLTMFGNIDILSIENRHESSNIKTAIISPCKRDEILSFILAECERGGQAYVVAPLIFDSEGLDRHSAEALFKELSKRFKDRLSVGFLHGKQKPAEKEEVLSRFSAGEISVLVSTTVVELGIDVANANIMAVFDAEQFGLATLHQLRGRVGRGGQQSYCFLFTSLSGDGEAIRLRVLTEQTAGLKIAESDYELRGAGDWIGESQSGNTPFSPTIKIMKTAGQIADEIDISSHLDLLNGYVKKLQLHKISFN